jgi:hypothetical protein|tara:strand:- start:2955 stop:3215 length:261 start_codon:yes stop_codon:yes gene_type:complete
MNGKQSRKLRLKSKELVMEWVRSLLNEEEAEKISLENYHLLVPKEKYVFANRKLVVSAYTERWFYQNLKKLIKEKSLKTINLKDFL